MIKLLISKLKYSCTVICLLTLQSCSSIQPHQSLIESTKTVIAPNIWPKTTNGSLFQERTLWNYGYQPLFEDHRAHNVGDIITIILQENISASNGSFSDSSRDGSSNLGVKVTPGPLNSIFGMNLEDNTTALDTIGKNNFYGKGTNAAHNKFSGLITATVQKVYPNGNLQVIGEKQVSINQGKEFIRFSGVINPININKNNLIASTHIANAKIEYISRGHINNVHTMGWFHRLLLKLSPI